MIITGFIKAIGIIALVATLSSCPLPLPGGGLGGPRGGFMQQGG
ncbi:hypothetical protein EHW99_2667 [Erwinia amylovora]|uniref:Lipoprotein n=3 Tax=Erwinia amylovora TaxID=552 RepID=A0A831ESI4_ERWAM|nr:hypothetical protein EaACW_0922 [Erwinia amylovora ACW56400]QJQ55369.1 hypothetical protein EHX00_2667 [Erwinia amylovora]CBA19863.1 hypothetical protein predicted by Glimmer/Critica [Erwinia amylovora CFBP1430]CBX79762.1 hypothetical protein predicted by Glimmer/Critica [Erwinia amylovora ATCC BAA-2158]CCO77765.1 hypothetical protein BN432_0943 [Erwinia amylovora Ea356]CCO81551.1 hypothetical protein BN433_0956 [Erwinia amylovora Ea266]CCO85353.1 hypothetical protein BN434_0941 [Erwinia a